MDLRLPDTSARASGPTIVARPRIGSLLAAAWQRRTALVVAGGGYGKTTAVREAAAGGESRWVTLRPSDGLTETLSARIAAALGAPLPEEHSALAAATGADDRRRLAERCAALLCEQADKRSEDLLLVLDDLESVGADDVIGQLLRVLCLEAPRQLHIVLCGRRLPALGLGTARGRGEVVEVTAPDLAFTVAETAELLRARLGQEAVPMAEECWALTRGWAAALLLLVDRLDRLPPEDRAGGLAGLRRHIQTWRNFADEMVAGEPARTRRILAATWAAHRVTAPLLGAVGVPATASDLEGLWQRGLLAEAGDGTGYGLSPVLAETVAAGLAEPEARALRDTAARWFEDHGLLEDALECHVDGRAEQVRGFAARCGLALVRRGGAARLADGLRRHGTGGEPELDAVLAEALQAIGDWDGAIELFSRVQRAAGREGLAPAVAWRFGVLLYLRGQSARALGVLAAAHAPELQGADDAMVSAFLSSTLWSRGDVAAAAPLAEVALAQAQASGDACARAAAYVALALVAAGLGERERNEQCYRAALTAAAEAGDRVQLARIHANLSSRALEEGDYARAVQEAGLAVRTGASHRFFSALALSNQAEAHLRLGQLGAARTSLDEALEAYDELGSLDASVPQRLLGELYRQQGSLTRARSAFERARGLAEASGDAHARVFALCGLARTLAADDVKMARAAAREAAQEATSLERPAALCALAEVELRAGDRAEAAAVAKRAEAEARRTGDRAALADALEMLGAADAGPSQPRLRAAIELWDDVDDPVGAARARLALAVERGRTGDAASARRRLAELGVAVDIGAAGYLVARRDALAEVFGGAPSGMPGDVPAGPEVLVATLGRFAVVRRGEPVALAAWQSRKARDLFKLLIARRGRPLTREAAVEALWPEQDAARPGTLGNRLSVALSTIRKVLDPDRAHPPDHYLAGDSQSIALRLDHLSVDVVEFLDTARAAMAIAAAGDLQAAQTRLHRARSLYAGDFLEDDLYEDWAVECREEARSAALMVLRLLARTGTEQGSDETACEHLGQLLELDPYDEDAWLALVAAQLRLHRHGEARRRYAAYVRRMADLGIAPVALADTAGRRA